MEDKTINPTESLEIIDSMINTAKNKLADDGFLYMFWGWLVFISAISHYITVILNIEYGFIVWPVLMPLGAVVSIIYGNRQRKKVNVRSYIGTYLGYSWTAFLIAMFITLAFMDHHGIKVTYFIFMILYGIATLISGGLLNFQPLIIGSLFSFALSVASVFLGEKEQLLCIAAAIFCSYIVPGHLLHSKFKSQGNV